MGSTRSERLRQWAASIRLQRSPRSQNPKLLEKFGQKITTSAGKISPETPNQSNQEERRHNRLLMPPFFLFDIVLSPTVDKTMSEAEFLFSCFFNFLVALLKIS